MTSRITGYGVGAPSIGLCPVPVSYNGVPSSVTAYDFGQLIKNYNTGNWYINSGGGVFPLIASSSGSVVSLSGDSGSAVPNSSGAILVSGGSTGLTTSASGNTVSLTGTLAPASGGTGVGTLTGIVLGNGTSAFTSTTYTAAGSFTPAFTVATPGSSSFTYSHQIGRYTRLGAIVYFSATVTWSAFSAGSGSGTVSLNLPVTAVTLANGNAGIAHIVGSGLNIAAETTNYPVNFANVIGSAATSLVLGAQEQGATQSSSGIFAITVSQIVTGGGSLVISGWYFAA